MLWFVINLKVFCRGLKSVMSCIVFRHWICELPRKLLYQHGNLELDLDIKKALLRVSVHICFDLGIWRSRGPQNILSESEWRAEEDWEALV